MKKIDLRSLTYISKFIDSWIDDESHARSLHYCPALIMISSSQFAILIIRDNEKWIN